MAYSVKYCTEERCILVVINGELTLNLLQEIAMDVAKLANTNECCCIVNDLRDAKLTPKAFEVVNMPKTAQQSGVAQTFRRALIVGDRADEFKFLETVFINQGHIVNMFPTYDEGINWLFSGV
jgi:hypothetical protein